MIYLDYNATAPLADEVVQSITEALTSAWGNPSSSHEAGRRAKELISESRSNVAACIGADPSNIVFTSGGSESNNWVIQSILSCHNGGEPNAKPHVVTSTVEHDSVLVPLDGLAQRGFIELTKVAIDKSSGEINPQDVIKEIKASTKLVTIMLANNETGTIMPIKEIVSCARHMEAKFNHKLFIHTDAAQAIGKIPIDVVDLDVDFLTIAGHKFYGPRTGALYMKCPSLEPLIYGGGQERGLRAGTENTPMIVGLGMAAKLVKENLDVYAENMRVTRDYLEDKLKEVFGDNVTFNCKSPNRLPNTCNFSFIGHGLKGYKVVKMAKSFSCSTGSACHASKCQPSKVLLNFHIKEENAANALRISTGRTTSVSDIDLVLAELRSI
uniref:Selenocysteine lyase n=1 Tax=Ciona savignyi TaxID=51511 RepID=H2Z5N5_CIOSA